LAKKRKPKETEEEEEEIVIKLPEFDDEAFMKEETRAGKVSFIAIGWGVVAGIISAMVFWLVGYDLWQLPLVIGFVLMVGILGLLRFFKIDIKELNWKNWVGAALSYLATGLIVFIILINMPLHDAQRPAIREHEAYALDMDYWFFDNVNESTPLNSHGNNTLLVIITDNDEVESVTFSVVGPNGNEVPYANLTWIDEQQRKQHPWIPTDAGNNSYKDAYDISDNKYERYHENLYEYLIPTGLDSGTYTYTITAKDTGGHKTSDTGVFRINR